MGGAILRFVSQGHNVLLLDMTNGEPTPHGSPEIRQREWTRAAEILGVKRRLLGLKNREVTHDLASRHKVAGVIREHQASILFCPYFEDAHPDHLATTRIVEDARFDAKLTKADIPGQPIHPKWLFYYFAMHLRAPIVPTFCIDISAQIEAKMNSITAYESQFVKAERNRRIVEAIRQMNGYMGSRIGTDYAEPFYTREPIGLGSLDGLVM